MLKLAIVTALALLAVVANAEPPKEMIVHHHHHHTVGGPPRQQQQERPVKLRQGGPSKIFGWLGSRFAKIPHYLPRMPHFPARSPHPHKLPQYQATLIIPEPPKHGHHGKSRAPEKVKITQIKQHDVGSTYQEVAAIPEITDNTYSNQYNHAPAAPVYTVDSVPQIEVVPSTLLYQNQQILSTNGHGGNPTYQLSTPVPPAPLAAPPLVKYATARPVAAHKPHVKQQGAGIPIVPQSNGPDYFDTAYKGGSNYKENALHAQHQQQQQQQQQQAQHIGLGIPENNYGAQFEIHAQGAPQPVYEPAVPLGTLSGPLAGPKPFVPVAPAAPAHQTYQAPIMAYQAIDVSAAYHQRNPDTSYQAAAPAYQAAPASSYQAPPASAYQAQPVNTYQATATSHQGQSQAQTQDHQVTQIEKFANQALTTQGLESLISALTDSNQGEVNNYGAYSNLAPQVAAPPATQQQTAAESVQQGQSVPAPNYQAAASSTSSSSSSSSTDIPGVQILSQGSDGGNPVFEVIADANAPTYDGHPFDINKLISLIEPGAQLESAELSSAASEAKQSYSVPVPASSAAQSSTSGTPDLDLTSNNSSDSSLNKTINSSSTSLTSETTNNSSVSSTSSLISDKSKSSGTAHGRKKKMTAPKTLTGVEGKGNETKSSLKDIMDFFQQTGGKGYVVVEKKRHQPDNLTLDFDQTSDDDLTNGPTRVNITSDMIFSQLQFLQQSNSNTSTTTTSTTHSPIINDDDYSDPQDDLYTAPLLPPPEYPNTDAYIDEDYFDTPSNINDNLNDNIAVDTSSVKNSTSVQDNTIILDTNKDQKTEKNVKSSTTESPLPSPSPTMTTLFEPVTSGNPAVVFTTTPPSLTDGETLNPHHNYHASSGPKSHNSTTYPLVGQSNSDAPTINHFLDAVDESVLDEPEISTGADLEGEEGDLSVAESQQVSSIAITVTPPPRATVERNGRGGKGTTTPIPSGTTSTTTLSPSTTEIDTLQLLATATKKPSTAAKTRPAPVYKGKKNSN